MTNLVESRNVNEENLICPIHDCNTPINPLYIKGWLSEELWEKYDRFTLENYEKGTEAYKICPNMECQIGYMIPTDATSIHCIFCNITYCPQCNNEVHTGISWEEAMRKKGDDKELLEMLE